MNKTDFKQFFKGIGIYFVVTTLVTLVYPAASITTYFAVSVVLSFFGRSKRKKWYQKQLQNDPIDERVKALSYQAGYFTLMMIFIVIAILVLLDDMEIVAVTSLSIRVLAILTVLLYMIINWWLQREQ